MNLPLAPVALAGVAAVVVALVLGVYAVVEPGRVRLPAGRARPVASGGSGLSRLGAALTGRFDAVLQRRDVGRHVAVLERAGISTPFATVALLVMAGALGAGVVGLVLAGPAVGVVLAVLAPLVVRVLLNRRAGRRRAAFAAQLEDSLQLMASSLRAGHSLIQALGTVARDSEEPSKAEFIRVLNKTRVGRDLGLALDETAVRMASPDFAWVTEAIAINREVGGNLAEVLDRVISTIRDRSQLQRQVRTLSAEGRLSAYILMALPFFVTGFLLVVNPGYLAKFTQSVVGYGLLALSVVMLTLGAVWLRKVVSIPS